MEIREPTRKLPVDGAGAVRRSSTARGGASALRSILRYVQSEDFARALVAVSEMLASFVG